MKKLLSLVLAAAMLAAVSVPSFAAEINQDTADGKGVATVKTDTTNVPADGYFTVTYPAEMSVKWGAETTAFTYNVKSTLKTGKCLSVSVASEAGKMKPATDNGYTIPYAFSGDTSVKTAAEVVNNTYNINVDVAAAAWNATITDYSDATVTFTAAVVDK